jgi:hypothetical protein
MQKSCSNCSEPARFSVVAVISTVGVSGRLQKSSPAVLFCDACLRELGDRLCSDPLSSAVNSAYTAVEGQLRGRTASQDGVNHRSATL